LNKADLSGSTLRKANLSYANLVRAKLSRAQLQFADLSNADLTDSDLSNADLTYAMLRSASLNRAKLCDSVLEVADLRFAQLVEANVTDAKFGRTLLVQTNLNQVVGIETCSHSGPTVLDRSTLAVWREPSAKFMKGCGFADWEIEAARLFAPNLTPAAITEILYKIDELRSTRPILIAPLFISYSHADADFVNHLGQQLDSKGLRYWRDVRDATSGPLEHIVISEMRERTVLLVLSTTSVKSDWVEFEAQKARDFEKETGRHVLCPISLDDSWKTCKWSPVLRNQIEKYNILPFSDWSDPKKFDAVFARLLDGLNVYYAKEKTDTAET
jgi:hypothetical protein